METAASKVLRSGHYIGGKEVDDFEKSFAASVCVPYAIGCNSGTDALILALRALDIGPGDEVLTPSFSFFATAEAISNVGAKPVFIDIDPKNFLINTGLIEKAITSATKAILPVHLFGCPVDMDVIVSIAKKNRLKIIEDCAQAAGSYWRGKPVGGIGDIGCFSFFPTKNLGAAGDGGAVTTHDPEIAQRVREIAVHGMPRRYFHTNLGYNSRLDALQAAILSVKLPMLSDWVKKRQAIALRYQKLLKGIPGLEMPGDSINDQDLCGHSWNQFVVKIKGNNLSKKLDREEIFDHQENNLSDSTYRDWLKEELSKNGVNTIIYYPIPIHLQPIYQEIGYKDCKLPFTEKVSHQVLSLPIFPELTLDKQDYVVNQIRNLLLV